MNRSLSARAETRVNASYPCKLTANLRSCLPSRSKFEPLARHLEETARDSDSDVSI